MSAQSTVRKTRQKFDEDLYSRKDGAYEIAVDLLGFKKDEINLEVKDGYLTISAEKGIDKDKEDKKGRVLRQERYSGVYTRSFYVGDVTPGKKLGDLMREVYPGTWSGKIDFTLQPAWCHLNATDFQLWENDGSGSGIITRNSYHKNVCSTKERLSYYPTLGQQIFDIDLNKMLVCIDVKNKKWVDYNGQEA